MKITDVTFIQSHTKKTRRLIFLAQTLHIHSQHDISYNSNIIYISLLETKTSPLMQFIYFYLKTFL